MTDWTSGAGFNSQPEAKPTPPEAVGGTVETGAAPELQLTVAEKNALIKNWLDHKNAATVAVDAEKALREKVTGVLFPNPKKGTQRYNSPEGFGSIKLVHGWNFTLGDKDALDSEGLPLAIRDQVEAMLTAIEELGERGRLIADRVVKWKPELVVSEYELLAASEDGTDVDAKVIIDELLTVKPASPQLSFEPPKVKK